MRKCKHRCPYDVSSVDILNVGGKEFRTVMEPDRPEFFRTLVADLDARGYDVKTLRFSIRRKP